MCGVECWDMLQDVSRQDGPTFFAGTNPLTDLAADVTATLGRHTLRGRCLRALLEVYERYYEHHATTLRAAAEGTSAAGYVPPVEAPTSVTALFANRHGFLWQGELERALADAVAWAATDDTVSV